MSADDFDAEARDAQTREEFAKAQSIMPSLELERARGYLVEHDEEAHPQHKNAEVIFSPEFLAAAEVLFTEARFEYRRLVIDLKKRGYHGADFESKVRETHTERKKLNKQRSRAQGGGAHYQKTDGTDSVHSQNGTGPQNTTADRWKTKLLAETCPFISKGFTASYRGRAYCYVLRVTNSLIVLTPASHRPPAIFELAPVEWWMANYLQLSDKGVPSLDWAAAQSDLFTAGGATGVFDPTLARRGIGLWNDEGRLIFHKGDELIAEDGTRIRLAHFKSNYIYEPRGRVNVDINQCASHEEAGQLTEVLTGFRWKNALSPKLLAGWVAIAPLSAALEFRPTAWITGGDQSGKSTILAKVIIQSLGGDPGHFVIVPTGAQTTEAFLRQSVDSDSKAIVFDEADQPDEGANRSRNNMAAILNYIRGSNSPGGVGKGGADGVPVHYTGKPMFLIASISLPISEAADFGRTLVFQLWRPEGTKEAADSYAQLRESIRAQFSDAFGHRLIARCIKYARHTLNNIAIFRTVLTDHDHDARSADRLATVLAGARSLTNEAGNPLTLEEAQLEIKTTQFGDFANVGTEYAERRDERAFWDYLISQRIRIEHVDYTIGELIDDIRGKLEGNIGKRDALARYGIRFDNSSTQLHIARGKKAFADLLKGTKWCDNYYLHLNRLLEASGLDPAKYTKQLRFKGLGQAYATTLPPKLLNVLLGGTWKPRPANEN